MHLGTALSVCHPYCSEPNTITVVMCIKREKIVMKCKNKLKVRFACIARVKRKLVQTAGMIQSVSVPSDARDTHKTLETH